MLWRVGVVIPWAPSLSSPRSEVTIMRKILWVILLSALALSSAQSKTEPADIVFKNGNIYTVNERQPHAEAIAVRAGRIVFVGSNKEAKAYEGRRTRVVDLQGKTVVPGLTD